MGEHPVDRALELWGWNGARATLIAARENAVYRVERDAGPVALRFHRQGLRSHAELQSELLWMAALAAAGLGVPAPIATKTGAMCIEIAGVKVDALTWVDGEPMGREGCPKPTEHLEEIYHSLGQEMAKLHIASDTWKPPVNFERHSWDKGGLLGEAPLWGRFWENPRLTSSQKALLQTAGESAFATLSHISGILDYGLIHADLVPDNVMVEAGRIRVIDFDDGGYGFRLFDIATTLNRARRTDRYEALRSALLAGYTGEREIDLVHLPLFQAVRAFTYVGWIATRLREPGADARCTRLTDEACEMAKALEAS